MAKHREPKAPKTKPIDLGAAQTAYENAKKQLAANAKHLAKAQDSFAASKKAYQESHAELKQAAAAVLE